MCDVTNARRRQHGPTCHLHARALHAHTRGVRYQKQPTSGADEVCGTQRRVAARFPLPHWVTKDHDRPPSAAMPLARGAALHRCFGVPESEP